MFASKPELSRRIDNEPSKGNFCYIFAFVPGGRFNVVSGSGRIVRFDGTHSSVSVHSTALKKYAEVERRCQSGFEHLKGD
jgi:hypothetical protein